MKEKKKESGREERERTCVLLEVCRVVPYDYMYQPFERGRKEIDREGKGDCVSSRMFVVW